MPTYRITVPVTVTVAYTIDAGSPEEAIEQEVDLADMFRMEFADVGLTAYGAAPDESGDIQNRNADWCDAAVERVGPEDDQDDEE